VSEVSGAGGRCDVVRTAPKGRSARAAWAEGDVDGLKVVVQEGPTSCHRELSRLSGVNIRRETITRMAQVRDPEGGMQE